jgi:hypothetical protein
VDENVHTGIGYKHPLTPAKNSADTWWLWHLTKNNNIIKHDNVALLSENVGETELDLFLRSEEAPRMEQVEYNPLVATGSTSLRSSDATDLQISEEGLKGRLEIQVKNDDDQPAGNPQASDNNMLWIWLGLLCVSAMGIFAVTVFSKKKSVR